MKVENDKQTSVLLNPLDFRNEQRKNRAQTAYCHIKIFRTVSVFVRRQ